MVSGSRRIYVLVMADSFTTAFVFYFVVIDPVGAVPLFMGLTDQFDRKQKYRVAFESTVTATIILCFFALIGTQLLDQLKISFPAFKIAGGILLLLIAVEMLFGKRGQRKEQELEKITDDVTIFPLAVPLLAGPAGIVSVMVVSSGYGEVWSEKFIALAPLVSVMILTLFAFLLVATTDRFISKKVTQVFSRVIAIIFAGLSVQYIIDGIKSV